MKKLVLMSFIGLLLTGCGVYNKYERPDVETQGLVRDVVSDVDTLVVQDTASFGNMPWRAVFTDPHRTGITEECQPAECSPYS